MLDIPGKEVVKEAFEKKIPIEMILYYQNSTFTLNNLKKIVE
jgi:hypothetical protein